MVNYRRRIKYIYIHTHAYIQMRIRPKRVQSDHTITYTAGLRPTTFFEPPVPPPRHDRAVRRIDRGRARIGRQRTGFSDRHHTANLRSSQLLLHIIYYTYTPYSCPHAPQFVYKPFGLTSCLICSSYIAYVFLLTFVRVQNRFA